MFCKKPLGSNGVIESFPVGRRLAFDAARGRLWVVCRRCERWNLTPLEERWEAVEDCERIFRGTRVRVSTEHIGLARHPEGLTLVRIGEPLRPEFAAWRYGDQFGRRRRKAAVYGGVVIAAATGLAVGGLAVGAALSTVVLPFPGRAVASDGGSGLAARQGATGGRSRAGAQASPRRGAGPTAPRGRRTAWLPDRGGDILPSKRHPEVPDRGRSGGSRGRGHARDGERLRRDRGHRAGRGGRIEAKGSAEGLIAELAAANDFKDGVGRPGLIAEMPEPTRLALEMALHEEQERRALEGELWRLERAWREAEEIAGISDDLLLPEGAEDFVRAGGREEDGGRAS